MGFSNDNNWFVNSTTGSDGGGNDGSRALPWKSITKAESLAINGDIIHVLDYAATQTDGDITTAKILTISWECPDDGKNGFDTAVNTHWIKCTGVMTLINVINTEFHATKQDFIFACNGPGLGVTMIGCTFSRVRIDTPAAFFNRFIIKDGTNINTMDYGAANIVSIFIITNSSIQNGKGSVFFIADLYFGVFNSQCALGSPGLGITVPLLAGSLFMNRGRISSNLDLFTVFGGANSGVIDAITVEGDLLGGAFAAPIQPHFAKLVVRSCTIKGDVDSKSARVFHLTGGTNVEGDLIMEAPCTVDAITVEGTTTYNPGTGKSMAVNVSSRGTVTVGASSVDTFLGNHLHNGLTIDGSATGTKTDALVRLWDDTLKDILNKDTYAGLPIGDPPDNPTPEEAQMWVYQLLQFKRSEDDTEQIVHDKDGNPIAKAAVGKVGGKITREKFTAP